MDDIEAVRWYRLGNLYCKMALGICYLIGKGVTKSLQEAQVWLEKAVSQGGDDRAKLYLAQTLFESSQIGIVKARILDLLLLAVVDDSEENKFRLVMLGKVYLQAADSNGAQDGDELEALRWYTQAIKAGATVASHALIRLFRLACGYNYTSFIQMLLDKGYSASNLLSNVEKGNCLMAMAERGYCMVFNESSSTKFCVNVLVELDAQFVISRDRVLKEVCRLSKLCNVRP